IGYNYFVIRKFFETYRGDDIMSKKDIDSQIKEEAKNLDYSIEGRKLTYQEFLKIDKVDNKRYEYIDGRIYLLASPVYKHQKILGNIYFLFKNCFKNKNCEPLMAPFDVTLFKEDKNMNIVQPDMLVICDHDKINKKGRYTGTPTLVLEILSDSTAKNDMIRKFNLYMKSGVVEYWVIDPDSDIVSIYYFQDKELKKNDVYEKDGKAKSHVFDGLEIQLKEIFT
ncbi:MAG: Uma2 family endonuclease, partial [bacterium]